MICEILILGSDLVPPWDQVEMKVQYVEEKNGKENSTDNKKRWGRRNCELNEIIRTKASRIKKNSFRIRGPQEFKRNYLKTINHLRINK